MRMQGLTRSGWRVGVLLATIAVSLSFTRTVIPIGIAPPSPPSRSGPILPIGHSKGVDAVAVSPDGKLVASGGVDSTIVLWEVRTGKALRTLTGHSSGVTSVAFSPDGRRLVSGSWDGTVRLWEVETGAVVRTLAGYRNGVIWVISEG